MIDTYFYNPTLLYDNTSSLVIATPNTELPVNVAKLKNSLRVTDNNELEELQDLIWAAAGYVEYYTGRALLSCQYAMSQRFFIGREIWLERTPVTAINSVTYRDTSGTTQTLDPSVYELQGGAGLRPQLALKYNQSWPTTDRTSAAITVNFTAGFATPAALRSGNPRLHRAIVMLASHLFNNREGIVVNARGAVLDVPRHLNSFISQLRTKHV